MAPSPLVWETGAIYLPTLINIHQQHPPPGCWKPNSCILSSPPGLSCHRRWTRFAIDSSSKTAKNASRSTCARSYARHANARLLRPADALSVCSSSNPSTLKCAAAFPDVSPAHEVNSALDSDVCVELQLIFWPVHVLSIAIYQLTHQEEQR